MGKWRRCGGSNRLLRPDRRSLQARKSQRPWRNSTNSEPDFELFRAISTPVGFRRTPVRLESISRDSISDRRVGRSPMRIIAIGGRSPVSIAARLSLTGCPASVSADSIHGANMRYRGALIESHSGAEMGTLRPGVRSLPIQCRLMSAIGRMEGNPYRSGNETGVQRALRPFTRSQIGADRLQSIAIRRIPSCRTFRKRRLNPPSCNALFECVVRLGSGDRSECWNFDVGVPKPPR
jgi:hypothetical protein